MKLRSRSLVITLVTFILVFSSVDISGRDNPTEIDQILNNMTLEQKVGQMFMVNLYGEGLSFTGQQLLEQWQPGGVVLFGFNIDTPEQITRLTNAYQSTVQSVGGPPLLIATDQEGGWIARLRDGFTEWPPMSLVAASGDYDLAYRVGQAMADELLAVGINTNLAPVADMDTNINNPIIGRRSPGSDRVLLDIFLRGYIAGMQDSGVMATAKHFPGHGDTSEDSHVTLPSLDHDLDRLQSVELVPFESAISGDVGAIMVAHIWYPELDGDDPLPATLSETIVTQILRQDLGYDGIIMTDAMDMDAIDTRFASEEAAILAIQAGIDLLTYGPGIGEDRQMRIMEAVVDAVKRGTLSEERITESVRRMLYAKQSLGLLEWQPLDPSQAVERIDVPGNVTLVQEMFRAGVTIAFDDSNLLPVEHNASVSIIYPSHRISINLNCREQRDDIAWVALTDFPSDEEIETAWDVASRSDVVIVFTRNTRENPNVQTLVNGLPQERTIAVALRDPYDLAAYPDVSGYVLTYGPQDPAIPAVCDILFGVVDARGKPVVNLQRDDQ